MSFSLAGKRILITGGTRGIGAEITKAAAAQSPRFIAIGYVSESSKKVAQELIAALKAEPASSSTEIVAVQGDLVDQKTCSDFVKSALSSAPEGKFDALVCSAGVMNMVSLAQSTDENFDYHYNVNVKGPLFTIQALLPNLANDGRIVLFSSSVTSHPMVIQPGYLPYAMSKGAVEQMVRVLAKDPSVAGPQRRITVNAIAPGATGTELFYKGKSPEVLARISGLTSQNRIGTPEEVADATISLLLPASRWINGQTIRVNGGQSL